MAKNIPTKSTPPKGAAAAAQTQAPAEGTTAAAETAQAASAATTDSQAAPTQAQATAEGATTAAETAVATDGQADGAEVATGEQAAADPAGPQAVSADPEAKRRYVVGMVPIRHDGKAYGVGHEIQLTDRDADRLAGLLVPIPE